MISISSFVVFLACLISVSSAGDPVTEGTELVFAFMVQRHGDRTPVPKTLETLGKSINQTLALQLINPYGFGQLTDAGKRTAYKSGQWIRKRYNGLISPKYNKSEIYIRTVDSSRCKVSALATLSAIFPAGKDNWSNTINWTPVPYTTVPAKYDVHAAFVNCPKYMAYEKATTDSCNPGMNPYADVLKKVSSLTEVDITRTPLNIFKVYDNCISLSSLGYNLSPDLKGLMGGITEAFKKSREIAYGKDSLLPLQAGPLLEEFFKYSTNIIAGIPTQRVRIYSGFDFNILSLLYVTRVKPQQTPKYGSIYSLELRRVTATGRYVVVPVYLEDPKVGVAKYQQIQGCGGQYLCDYVEFLTLSLPYVRDEGTWRKECGISESFKVDTYLID